MRQIKNEKYKTGIIQDNDIFICAFGYETRSTYLFEKIEANIKKENILIFFLEDNSIIDKIDALRKKGIVCIKSEYISGQFVQNKICDFVDAKRGDKLRVHIDYSSMPRNWYYNLPILLNEYPAKIYFWYIVGNYSYDYMVYPTAGIDTYTTIGKPLLRIEKKRVHVFGLSYDDVRTKAIVSQIDPDAYIVCNAFDHSNMKRGENVDEINQQLISKAISEQIFYYDDFSFMFSKLCEIAIEYSNGGNVIFVPDGPKPLIFAMSLVTLYLDKEGVSCIHIYRNVPIKDQVNVEPTDIILGFSI